MAGNGTIKYNVDFSVNKNGLNQLKSELQSIKTIAQQALNSPSANNIFENGKQDAKELLDSVSQLEGALTRAFNTNLGTLNVSKFNQELKNLNLSKIQADFAKAGAAGQNAFRNMTTQVLTTNMQLKQTHSLIDSMAETMGNTIKWGIASSIMNGFTRSVQNAYGYVKKLDTSLNNIMLVTDKSAENMKDFAKQANKAAKELGASTTAYTDAALIYYQQGLGDKEVAARAETTLKAANVTGQTGEEVSEQLTAVWNGYKVTAEETEIYVDKLAKVAASTASDLEELSTGMSKVASAANSMGVDVDQLNAQLATIISVTRQAPESVGTALKTIYARMGDLAVDGEDEFGVSLGEVSGKMEQMGIQIMDQQGNLRDMGTVIEETAKKWDTWTESQKQAAAVAMAGKRQYNNLIALFENWDMYEKALNTSANSVGFLQEQQDEYMDSMKAHLQELKTATESLYTSLIDSDSMNGLVDGLTVVVRLFDNFVQSIGGGGNLLLSLGAIGTRVFSKQIASGLATTIINLRASKENAAQLAAEMEMVGQLSNLQKDDPRYQRIIEMKKQELEYSKVITAEERDISNEYIRQTNELFKQQDALQSRKTMAEQTYQQFTGKKIDLNQQESAQQASNTFEREIIHHEQMQKEVAKVSQAYTEYGNVISTSAGNTEAMTEATSRYIETSNLQLIQAKKLLREHKLSKEEQRALTSAIKNYEKAKGNSNKTEYLTQDTIRTGNSLHETYSAILEKTIQKLREAKGASDTYTQELDELNNKLLNGKIAWEGFTSSISLKSMINNTVQAVGAVGQLAMSINYLRSMVEIFKNDELSFGEKTLQFIQNLSFMLPMVISGFSGLAKAMATTAAGQGYLAAAEAARIPILIAQVQAGKLSNITEAEREKILEALRAAQAGETLTEEQAILIKNLHSTANLGLAGTLKVAGEAMKGFFTSMGPIGWIILAIGALATIIGVLSAAVGDIETAEEKANRELKESQQALQDAENAAKSAADAYSQLKETIASYEDANNAIDDLTEGTNEWKEAVYKLNQQVLNLLQTYPELSKYITNDNGRLGITQEGIKYIQDEQMKKAENAQRQYYAGQIATEKKNFNASKERVKSDIQNQGKGLEDYSYDRSDIHDVQAEGTFKKQLQGDAASDKWMNKAIKSGNITSEDVKDLLAKDMEKAELTDEEKTTYADYISGASDEITDELLIKMGHIDKQKNSQSRGQITVADPTGANLMRELIKTYEVEGAKLREEQEKSTIQLLRLTSLQQKNQTNEKFNKLTTDEQNIINAMGVNSTTYQTKYQEGYNKVVEDLEAQKGDAEAIAKILTATGRAVQAEDIEDSTTGFIIKKADGTIENWTDAQLKEYYGQYIANNAIAGNGIADNGKSGYQEVLDEYNEKIKAVDEGTTADLNAIFSSGAISEGKIDFSKITIDELDSLYSEVNGNENWGVSDAEEDQKTQFAKLWGFDDYEIMRQDIIAQMNPEQMAKSYSTIAETASKAAEKTGTLIEALNSENELTEEQSAQLDALEQKYTTLGDIRDRTSSEYKQALEEIQQLEETEAINAQQKATEFAGKAVLDSFKNLDEKATQQQLQDLKGDLEAFFDEEYELQISIAEDLLSDVDNVINKAEGMQTAVAAIGDGFKVAADKSEELFDIFPELAHNAKVLSDGTIQLNQATVNSVLGNQEAVMNGDKKVVANAIKAKIQELEATNKVLDAEIAALEGGTLDRTALEDMFSKYKTEKQEEEAKNDKEVADTEIDNDAKVTKGVITNWEAKEKAAIAYGQTVKDIMAGKNVKKGRIGNTDFGVVSKVDTDDAKLEKDVDKLTDADIQEVLLKGKKNQKEANERIIADLTIGLAKMNYETTEGIKEAAKENEKQIELLESEKDLYHDINIEIQRLENSMEELERQQEKLYGQDLLNNLSKQLDLLEKQEDAQRRKLEIAKAEAEALKVSLAAQGTTFNSDGTISNYQALYDQKFAYVNSIKASGNEEAAEAAEKDFEQWQEDFARYDELVSSEIFEIEQSIQDAIDKAIEKQIEAFDYEIQLKLDLKDANREWNDFKKEMLEEDDILGRAGFNLETFKTYLGDEGTINTLTEKSNTLLDQLKQINETGTSSIYGDNKAKLIEDLQAVQEELMSAMQDQKDVLEEIEQAYLDMLDAAQEAFDEQIAQYEAINEVYSHGLNVINLLYGEDAYAEMEGFYQSTIENTNDLISFQAQQVQMWKEKLNDPSLTDEQRDEIQKKMQEAQAAVLSSVETQLDNIVNKYTNVINKIFKELEDKMTGGKGLSYIQEEWDLLNQNADMYLDQVNSAYEVEKLVREYNKAINTTDSLSAQRKLNELMEEQLKGLREKEKLTQYDVDRANALLDIELKRIALEEAQQNKSKMRLRRDASGNYSYQFVSDEDATAQAQQELADAQNSLYNLSKDEDVRLQEEIMAATEEFVQKKKELALDLTLTEQERLDKEKLLNEQYATYIDNLTAQHLEVRKYLEQDALDTMAALNLDYTMTDLIPTWDTGIHAMAEYISGEGGLLPSCSDAFSELSGITQQYMTDLDTLEQIAGVDLGNVASYTDTIVDTMTPVLESNQELINKYSEEIRLMGELQTEAQTLAQTYDAITTAAMAAVDAMLAARQTEADINAEKAAQEAAAQQQAANEAAAAAQQQAAQQPSLAVGTGVTVKTTATHFSRDGGNGTRMKSFVPGSSYAVMQVSGNEVLIGRGGVATGWVNKTDLVGFNTGGYTGDWSGDGGRLAFLHKKELILNAKDTKNILQAVDVVRQIDGIMSSIMGNAFDRVNNQVRGLNSMSFPVGGPTSSEAAVAQHIEINADFPGVEKASEIISAFENLTNMATQYAFRTDR